MNHIRGSVEELGILYSTFERKANDPNRGNDESRRHYAVAAYEAYTKQKEIMEFIVKMEEFYGLSQIR